MSSLDMMINNMTTYAHVPPMTVREPVKVVKTGDTLMWENEGQVSYLDTVSINGGNRRCVVVNGLYNTGLSVSSPGVIELRGVTIPADSSLIVNTDQAIFLTHSTIQGTIQCVGGNPGVIVDLDTLCNSSLQNIPILSTVSQFYQFTTDSLTQTIVLPVCPGNGRFLLYGFFLPGNPTTPIITLRRDTTGWTVYTYDTTLLKACTITDPHTLQLTWAKNTGVTQLIHHFL